MSRQFTLIRMALCMMVLVGCKTTPSATPPAGMDAIDLSLQSITTDKRYTYFELTPDGMLSFAGGYDAINKNARPIFTLTKDDLQKVHSIIEQANLIAVKVSGNHSRKNSQKVHYELTLNINGKHNNITVNDDEIPGINQLHDLLFDLQARERYNLPGIGSKQ